MRLIVLPIGAALLAAGCGTDSQSDTAVERLHATPPSSTAPPTREPKPAARKPSARKPSARKPKPAAGKPKPRATSAPRYVPSAHHAHRPRGYIYGDEVGENVLIAPYRRVIELFGPPASRRGKCIRYRIVRFPRERWEFCFKGQKMTGAMIVRPRG